LDSEKHTVNVDSTLKFKNICVGNTDCQLKKLNGREEMTYIFRRILLPLILCVSASAFAELKISGSESLESYFQNALSQYARGPGAGVSVKSEYKGSGQGLKELCEGRVGIALASIKLEGDALARCTKSSLGFVELPIAYDSVVVIAHPSHASMSEVTIAELKTIFNPENAGKITRWSQVRAGLSDTQLSVVSLNTKSGTTAFFGNKVYGMAGFVRPDAKVTADNHEVIKMVAADPNAIGFVSSGALTDSKAAVWRVPVNFGKGPVVASNENVLNDSYGTLSRPLYVYVAKSALAEKDGQALAFMTWLIEHATKLANYEGLIPLIDANYAADLRKLTAK
jgi:phosphate transport system substrate-binding protein